MRLQSGRFYIMQFGRGTQIIYVESISKTGKRAVIRRCQAWRSSGANWDLKTPSVSVDDRRVQGELRRVPLHVPDLPSLDYVEASLRAHAELRSLWRVQTIEVDTRTKEAFSDADEQLKSLCSNPDGFCQRGYGHSTRCPAQPKERAIRYEVRGSLQERHKAEIAAVKATVPKNVGRPVPR